MIKIHAWIPDNIRDWFKWEFPKYIPKSDYGMQMLFFDFNIWNSKLYTAWWAEMPTAYPHTLKYRFIRSICDNDFEELKICLDKQPLFVHQTIYKGFTPLSLAASLNQTAMVEYLLLRGAQIDQIDQQGRTPLIQAVFNWQIETIKTLVDSGAPIHQKGKYGYSALQIAKKKGFEQIALFLEFKAKENIQQHFPKPEINFDFEKLIRNPSIEEIFQNKKIFLYDPLPYPFNDFNGLYKIDLVKTQNYIQSD